ncbi:zinc ribbon domain-containing protein [Selenomonas ruminantium]|uniref:zinc ribbon domain-containing protein n=1 Tax=Selenomonas ruminantium TaxID=971 RepID=UPI0026F1C942|nr:zinc ribbon domain-containing protein [Selenomonas ruminantium]
MAGFCTNCGAPLEEKAKFCVECGATVPKEMPAANPVSEPQPPIRQQAVPQMIIREDNSDNKGVIALLLIIIVLLVVGGGYLFLDNRQQPAVNVVHQDKSPNTKQDKNANMKPDGEREYVSAAAAAFRENEESLASLAAAINSGSYSKENLLNMVSSTVKKMNTNISKLQKSASADAAVSREINELFEIETKRAECMRQGIQGNVDQYRVGGEYYDQFQIRFKSLKSKYNL